MPVLVAPLPGVHALVHRSFVSPRRPPAQDGAPAGPFSLDHSWALLRVEPASGALRLAGIALLAAVLTARRPG